MSRHLMLMPSLACPASCAYCFGPHAGGPLMRRETVEAVARWQNALGEKDALEIVFHGGEPLVPGAQFYRMALPLLRDQLSPRPVSFAIQSNLWLLTDELCELLHEHRVSFGTSLDGPEPINDAQRGAGCYQRTMAGIERARAHGMTPGCICTFTAQSARRAGEVFDFFLNHGLGFSIHAALPAMGKRGDGWALSPQAHGELLVGMLDRYLTNTHRISISTLDAMSRSVSAGHGGICTFGDCLGEYLAVDPQGRIYACQRLIGMPQFRLGNVHDCPALETLHAAPAWHLFQERQERIREECGDCPQFDFCRGGCPYNVLAANGGSFECTRRDPHCPAYKRAFQYITDRALEEVFSEENLAAVVAGGPSKHGLLRKGKLLHLMRGGPHPQEVSRQSRKVVAAVALAGNASPDEAVEKLEHAGLVTDRNLARRSLDALQSQLVHQTTGLVNAYIHVTYACSLACDHCYATSGPRRVKQVMPVEDVTCLVRESARAGFRKAVITGGEPLAHPRREVMLEALAALRPAVRPMQIVLRTNLVARLTPSLLERLSESADQIVVSVDGDEATHDARRGKGAFARTVTNLRDLVALKNPSGLTIAATLIAPQIAGAEGKAVRALGKELGVGVRFKPVLPLGRAAGQSLSPEFYSSLDEECDELISQVRLVSTCGLGMNLYIAPDGACFPCYALTEARHFLGNALTDGLEAVLARNDLYRQVTVDSNQKCGGCGLRYLCGGFCRAWSDAQDPDAPLKDCTALQARARTILRSAMEALEIRTDRWAAAGLPIE